MLTAVATSEIALRVVWVLGGALIGGTITMLGTLMFGRNYKKRFADMQEKIDELSQRPVQGHIQQTVNITQASDGTFVSRIQSPATPRVGTIMVIKMPERIAWIGTKHGALKMPFGDKPDILYEIVMGLEKNGLLDVIKPRDGSLGPEPDQNDSA